LETRVCISLGEEVGRLGLVPRFLLLTLKEEENSGVRTSSCLLMAIDMSYLKAIFEKERILFLNKNSIW